MMKLEVSVFISLLLWVQYPTTQGVIKRWRPNTNYDNPENWNVGRLPCDGDNLSFPSLSPLIFLEQEIQVIALTLPLKGEIVLGDGAAISAMKKPSMVVVPSTSTMTTQNSGSEATGSANDGGQACSPGQTGQKVKFIRTNYLNWLDPDNWCEAESDISNCLDLQPPRLDTERVPCITDDVIFPKESSFLVQQNYTSSEIKVKSLTIQGVSHTQESLAQFLETSDGKKQFSISQEGEIQLTEDTCEDVTGCTCGNDKGMLMHKICEFQATKCPPLYCNTPIMPKGHCCQICGTILVMDYHFGFKLSVLQQKINDNFIDPQKGKTSAITSKMSNDRIQVVVQDEKNDGTQARKSGEEIHEYIERDIRGPQKLGLNSINMQVSGSSLYPSPSHVKGGKKFLNSSGSIAGVVISIFIVLILVGAIMFCFVDRAQCRRRMKLPLALTNPFRRFGSDNEKNELEMDDSVSYLDIMKGQEEDNTFDNPMYNPAGAGPSEAVNQKGKQPEAMNNNEGPAIMDPTSVTFVKSPKNDDGGTTSFANPLFGTYQSNPTIIDPSIRLNPAFTEEGIEEDSNI